MAIPPPSLPLSELRTLRRDLAEINDAQLLRVVALVDRMAERGDADALIAPLRARFSRVRPPRPLRFTRLLFLPLDPVMIPAPQYRAGMPAVPHTVAAPLAAAVHAALGQDAADIEAMIAGHVRTDTDVVRAAGAILWPAAAQILRDAPIPGDWASAGLPVALHRGLTRSIAAVLTQAVVLFQITCDVAAGLPVEDGVVDDILARAAPAGPEGWSLVLAVLLTRLPATGTVMHKAAQWAARQGEPALIATIEPVLDTELTLLEARGAATKDLPYTELEVESLERMVDLLDGLAGGSAPASRRTRAEAIRRQLDASCRAQFADALTKELLAPLQAMTTAPATDAPPELEGAARNLRALETVARRLGGAGTYDALLRQTADAVQSLTADAGLSPVDTVRLVEILAGPEAALALLG